MHSIYLLRHAETYYNAHDIIGGRSNHIPLSKNGEQQAIAVGKRFKQQRLLFDKVFCSTAVRAVRTLELIMNQYVISGNIAYSDDLQERSQGDWEGQLRSTIYTEEQLKVMNSNRWLFRPPNGESQKEVEERMLKFIRDNILQDCAGGDFLIVGHGAAFKCLLRYILDISSKTAFKLSIDNASLTRINYDRQKRWFLDCMNNR